MDKEPTFKIEDVDAPKKSLVAAAELETRLDERQIAFQMEVASDGTFSIVIENDNEGHVDDIFTELETESLMSGKRSHAWLEDVQISGNQQQRVIFYNLPD